jgi:hypothetical protein
MQPPIPFLLALFLDVESLVVACTRLVRTASTLAARSDYHVHGDRIRADEVAVTMTAILKTLPTFFARGQIQNFLAAEFSRFYFTLGRGKPQRPDPVKRIYFTHCGVILGFFFIEEIVQNKGQLPLLTTLEGKPSEWQIKPDRWVAVCAPPFYFEQDKIYHAGFRGWRYFDLQAYRNTLESKVRL